MYTASLILVQRSPIEHFDLSRFSKGQKIKKFSFVNISLQGINTTSSVITLNSSLGRGVIGVPTQVLASGFQPLEREIVWVQPFPVPERKNQFPVIEVDCGDRTMEVNNIQISLEGLDGPIVFDPNFKAFWFIFMEVDL